MRVNCWKHIFFWFYFVLFCFCFCFFVLFLFLFGLKPYQADRWVGEYSLQAKLMFAYVFVYFLQDLTYLVRIPRLKVLGLKDPLYAPNPVCYLCNYSTHVLYHIPQLERLDSYDVSNKTLREMAEVGVYHYWTDSSGLLIKNWGKHSISW